MSDDRLYDRLKRMRVPEVENKEHELALRRRLEAMIAEPSRKPAFLRRPLLLWAGALAGAAAAVVAVFFLLHAPSGFRTAGDSRALVSLVSGEAMLKRGSVEKAIAPGDELLPGDTVSVSARSLCVLQLDGFVLARLEPDAALVYGGMAADNGLRTTSVRMLAGGAFFKVEAGGGRAVAVATEFATYASVGTVFMVQVVPGQRSGIAVFSGRMRVFADDARSRLLKEGVSAGESAWVDAAGRFDGSASFPERYRREAEGMAQMRLVDPAAAERPLRVSVTARPVDAFIFMEIGLEGFRRIDFLAEPRKPYVFLVTSPGYAPRTVNLQFEREETAVIELEKEKPAALNDRRPSVNGEDKPADGTDALEPPVTKAALVPRAAIAPSGRLADWTGLAPVLSDSRGDARTAEPGSDLADLWLAQDDEYCYIGISLADNGPEAALLPEFTLTLASENERLTVIGKAENSQWRARYQSRDSAAVEGKVFIGPACVEMRIPISVVPRADRFNLSLALTIQKYGRLRVNADETETTAVRF